MKRRAEIAAKFEKDQAKAKDQAKQARRVGRRT
jgi:hypothetical protein